MTRRRQRGRPPKLDRERAVAIAMKRFWEKGYEAVGVAELCDAIGIAPSSLYGAFGSKHGLFEAALDRFQAEEAGFIADAIDDADSLDALVRLLLEGAAESYARSETIRGCLVLDGARGSDCPHARASVHARRRAAHAVLARAISVYDPTASERLATYVLVAMTGLSGSARMGETLEQLREAARQFAANVSNREKIS